MRSEQEMIELIISTARNDERIRAVIMNGSRANPNALRDPFQDFDIVYIVTEVNPYKYNYEWIKRFGDIIIMQMPEDMEDPPPSNDGTFVYLMQFTDGNRIDLTLFPLAKLDELDSDSLSLLLLDKDGVIEPFEPANESDYIPKPPTAKAFSDCCNEFWWLCTHVAKGLWREELTYAKCMFDQGVRGQLMKMITWYVGVETKFLCNPGKFGAHLRQFLEPGLWSMLEKTYSDANYEKTWDALYTMCDLFRITANRVAGHFKFDYSRSDDEKVSAHLKHVRVLPKNTSEIY